MIESFCVFAALALGQAPEERALDYLALEAPRWRPENQCASCHHNGDAARALYEAVRLKRVVPDRALENTTDWLSRPAEWDHNGGDGPFSDKGLARIQFTAALAQAIDAEKIAERKLLIQAADRLVKDQRSDGSWRPDATNQIGSAVTYGTALATATARDSLYRADRRKFADSIAQADQWLRQAPTKRVLDASAILRALANDDDADARRQRQACLETLKQGESASGGWGPYVNSGPEVFDTALAVLALSSLPNHDHASEAMLRRGRAFLVDEQLDDGSWQETTRPPGAESLAQRLSTTGWATLALLATAP